MQPSSKFPLAKMLRLRSTSEAPEIYKKVATTPGIAMAPDLLRCWVDLDLQTKQITLLPTSIEELSIPPALLFTKDQTQEIKMY